MVEFHQINDALVLRYKLRDDNSWVYDRLNRGETVVIKGTYHLRREHLYDYTSSQSSEDQGEENLDADITDGSVDFKIGSLEGEYFVLDREIMQLDCDLTIHKDVELTHKSFTAEKNVSIFQRLSELRPGRIVIGGTEADSLPEAEFNRLIKYFPNTYELKRYVLARVSSVIRDFFETQVDGEALYHRYMNRRLDPQAQDIVGMFRENEVEKYVFLQEKLTYMLNNEVTYNEAKWQAEILQIILLLHPKYIRAFEEAPIRDTYNDTIRSLDILLVDSSGNVDIVEIKQPFDKCIITSSRYRDNYIPLRELSGTVMQIEKYIFYFNKWGRAGEKYLTEKYKKDLPRDFKIRITNPGGIIIMGRDNNLSAAQRQDFEVVKRKYKSIIDVITYDELLRRLNFTIEQLRANT